jgi:exodeoxyribonuclease-1
VHANKSPALAPLSVLAGADTPRIGLNAERCLAHLELLRQAADLTEKVRQVFSVKHDDNEKVDPELALYHALPSDADKRLRHDVRVTPTAEFGARNFPFRDPRYPELLFRYRARNFPASLSLSEAARWDEYRRAKLTTQTETTTLTLDAYFQEIAALRATSDVTKTVLFDALEQWGRQIL